MSAAEVYQPSPYKANAVDKGRRPGTQGCAPARAAMGSGRYAHGGPDRNVRGSNG